MTEYEKKLKREIFYTVENELIKRWPNSSSEGRWLLFLELYSPYDVQRIIEESYNK